MLPVEIMEEVGIEMKNIYYYQDYKSHIGLFPMPSWRAFSPDWMWPARFVLKRDNLPESKCFHDKIPGPDDNISFNR